jgi:hypothetical protein
MTTVLGGYDSFEEAARVCQLHHERTAREAA